MILGPSSSRDSELRNCLRDISILSDSTKMEGSRPGRRAHTHTPTHTLKCACLVPVSVFRGTCVLHRNRLQAFHSESLVSDWKSMEPSPARMNMFHPSQTTDEHGTSWLRGK